MKTITGEDFFDLLFNQHYSISDWMVTDPVTFPALTLQKRTIIIKNIEFKGEVIISNDINDLTFKDCKFHEELNINKIQGNNIHIHNCTFVQGFAIDDCSVGKIVINDIQTYKAAVIRQISTDLLHISELSSVFHLLSISSKRLVLTALNERCSISIIDKIFLDSQTDRCKVDNLIINCVNGLKGKVNIRGVDIKNFEVRGRNTDTGEIYLSDISVGNIKIRGFRNDGHIRLQDIISDESSSSLLVEHSSLGKAELINVDFYNFEKVAIRKSLIENIVCAKVKWCKADVRNFISMNYPDRRELFRQLKNVMIKSNNRPEELKFLSLEMEAYTDEMKYSKGHWADRFILWSSGFSNKHGLSWERALGIIAITTIVFYTAIKGISGYIYPSSKYIIPDITNAIEFINPVHKFAEVFGVESQSVHSTAKLLDVLYRILISYMLYQFLAAFRKYGKK